MNGFKFEGSISASKSLMNRALIIQSHFNHLNIYGQSSCDDVTYMKAAIADLINGKTKIACGSAGTVLRFMALRVAREKEEFLLTGTKKLLSRLPDDLVQLLSQLGAKAQMTPEGLKIKSIGWKVMGDALHLQAKLSSQFASAVFLNAWDYPLDLFISVPKSMRSQSYFRMTTEMLSSLGMKIFSNQGEYHIPKKQILTENSYVCEPDMSSCFALAAAACLGGEAHINNISDQGQQPDADFFSVLDLMQIDYEFNEQTLTAHFFRQDEIGPIDFDLGDTPDLFPVLSVLCAFANGDSELYGAEHLSHKESDRISETHKLLNLAGVETTKKEDGLIIHGQPYLVPRAFAFDANDDHRIAMAAGLLMLKGCSIDLSGRESVNKSFPEFWSLIGK